MKKTLNAALLLILAALSGCVNPSSPTSEAAATGTPAITTPATSKPATILKTREEVIPADAIKMTPETDYYPPILHSSEYLDPVPLSSAINTAGGEDSGFVTFDGSAIYIFFTPDVNIPAEQQLFDGVTGIWVSYKKDNQWSPAQRILLQDEGELALDGCEFVMGNEMWFGSARKGNYRGIDVWIADFIDSKWTNWRNAGEKLNVEYEVGEFHITADGNELYFHSDREGGQGEYDIWVTRNVNGEWQEPENIEIVNTPEMEGWPFVTPDGNELWFTRIYQGSPAIFVSRKIDGQWGQPELVISQFAGEPSVDIDGNIYFTHHFFHFGKMIEGDIYVALHK